MSPKGRSIPRATIRFYEKEGLLTPSRNENGYREYSDADITQLKQIVILRKLGIPVQQIGDILDGALPLQDALEENIASLNAQIDAITATIAQEDAGKMRNVMLVSMSLWVIFDIAVGAYTNIITHGSTIVSLITAKIRLDREKKEQD